MPQLFLQITATGAEVSPALTPEQQAQAWNAFLNWGIVGIIAFVSLSFAASILIFFWWVIRSAIVNYGPKIVNEAVATMTTIRDSQSTIVETQKKQVANAERLIELHADANKRSEDFKTKLFDPIGRDYANHNFSATRVEECLLRGLDALEEHLQGETDASIKLKWSRHIQAMRDSLRHKV